MLSKVEAAYKILKAAKKPLNTHEIIEKALKRGLVSTVGKTPADTLRVDIYQENKRREKKKIDKRFNEIGGGVIGLVEWDK
jgi:hypothetical protein